LKKAANARNLTPDQNRGDAEKSEEPDPYRDHCRAFEQLPKAENEEDLNKLLPWQ
jgi:hypothetical protein